MLQVVLYLSCILISTSNLRLYYRCSKLVSHINPKNRNYKLMKYRWMYNFVCSIYNIPICSMMMLARLQFVMSGLSATLLSSSVRNWPMSCPYSRGFRCRIDSSLKCSSPALNKQKHLFRKDVSILICFSFCSSFILRGTQKMV